MFVTTSGDTVLDRNRKQIYSRLTCIFVKKNNSSDGLMSKTVATILPLSNYKEIKQHKKQPLEDQWSVWAVRTSHLSCQYDHELGWDIPCTLPSHRNRLFLAARLELRRFPWWNPSNPTSSPTRGISDAVSNCWLKRKLVSSMY